MKNNKLKTSNKLRNCVICSLVIGGGITGALYIKNLNNNLETEHIVKNNDIDSDTHRDIIDIKDFAYKNTLIDDENLNKLVSYGRTLNNNFLYLKRDASFKDLELYKLNENDDLVQYLNVKNANGGDIELNSFVGLSDGCLVLQTDEYVADMESSIFSLQKYNKNGELEFNKIIDNNINILNLYSFENLEGFISMESDSKGDVYIVKYSNNGEEIFRYKIIYDYNSNIDVIYKNEKLIFVSMGDYSNIIEIDNTGNEIRKLTIPYEDIRINKLFATSDNGYVVSFTNNTSDNYESLESNYLKLNSDGEKEWIHLEKSNSFTQGIHEIKDGYLLFNNDVYYEEKEGQLISSNLYSILKINKSGEKEWVKHIKVNDEVNNSIFTVNGNYLNDEFLVISGVLEDSDNNAYLIKFSIDKDGYTSHILNKNNDTVG